MSDMTLSLACLPTDRSRAVLEGRIHIPGVSIRPMPGTPGEIFVKALKEQAFDITEMSMASHIMETARGTATYVGVPIFLSRLFRHSAIYVRSDRGIDRPEDLKGRRVGVPEFPQTAGMWVRGILRDEHGVGVRDVSWRIGGQDVARASRRSDVVLPAGLDVAAIPDGETLNGLLAKGELDAIISPHPPPYYGDAGVPVRRLFEDYAAREADYHTRTGFFPIMHCVAIRKSLAAAHPELPLKVFRAFVDARNLAMQDLEHIDVLRVSLPFLHKAMAEMRALMGADLWPYGFARNQKELAAMTRYAHEDGLTASALDPAALFHPSTLGLTA